jgi:hypothetical protein
MPESLKRGALERIAGAIWLHGADAWAARVDPIDVLRAL